MQTNSRAGQINSSNLSLVILVKLSGYCYGTGKFENPCYFY